MLNDKRTHFGPTEP